MNIATARRGFVWFGAGVGEGRMPVKLVGEEWRPFAGMGIWPNLSSPFLDRRITRLVAAISQGGTHQLEESVVVRLAS
jgi:hypothetical protein